MKFIILSDIHIGSKPKSSGLDPADCLRAAVRDVSERAADADFCILLGDLTDRGAPEEYALLKEILADLPMSVKPILGNHDAREGFKAAFPDQPIDENGFVQYSFDAGVFRFVMLDTYWPENGGGTLDSGRLDWLTAQLAEADRPCLVFLHHPPFYTGVPGFEALSLRERPELETIIATHAEKVTALFSGHLHMSANGVVAGRPAFGMRSTFYQIGQNFADRKLSSSATASPAYGIVLTEGENLTVHTVEFDVRPI